MLRTSAEPVQSRMKRLRVSACAHLKECLHTLYSTTKLLPAAPILFCGGAKSKAHSIILKKRCSQRPVIQKEDSTIGKTLCGTRPIDLQGK